VTNIEACASHSVARRFASRGLLSDDY